MGVRRYRDECLRRGSILAEDTLSIWYDLRRSPQDKGGAWIKERVRLVSSHALPREREMHPCAGVKTRRGPCDFLKDSFT